MVRDVKPADVDRAAKTYFVRDNRVVGLYIPTDETKRAEITAAPGVDEVLSRYTFSEKGSEAEAFDVSQDNIDKRTTLLDIGDVKVALLPKKTRGETVVVQMQFNNGNNETSVNAAIPMLAVAMLSRGTDTMTIRSTTSSRPSRWKVLPSASRRTANTSPKRSPLWANSIRNRSSPRKSSKP